MVGRAMGSGELVERLTGKYQCHEHMENWQELSHSRKRIMVQKQKAQPFSGWANGTWWWTLKRGLPFNHGLQEFAHTPDMIRDSGCHSRGQHLADYQAVWLVNDPLGYPGIGTLSGYKKAMRRP